MDRSEGEKPRIERFCFKPEAKGSRASRTGET